MTHKADLTGDYETTIYDVARRLLAEGADLADTVETWRGGKLSMSGKVGELAKWQVVFASTGPRLVRHKGCILARPAAPPVHSAINPFSHDISSKSVTISDVTWSTP
jgi:hypothetical protein